MCCFSKKIYLCSFGQSLLRRLRQALLVAGEVYRLAVWPSDDCALLSEPLVAQPAQHRLCYPDHLGLQRDALLLDLRRKGNENCNRL